MTTSTMNTSAIVYAVNGLIVINNAEEKTSYLVEDVGFNTINSLVNYTKRHIGREVEDLNSAYYTELNTYAVTRPDLKDLENFKKTMINKYTVYTKYRNQTFARMFGGSPKVIVNCMNGVLYNTRIKPICNLKPLWNYHQTRKMVQVDQNLKEAIKRTEKILSFERNVSAFGLIFDNPQTAKKELGKGLWKSICNNSNNKNCLIIAHTLEGRKDGIDTKTIIEGLTKMPSTWLNRFRNLNVTLPAVFTNGNRASTCWLLQLQKSGESLSKMFSPGRIEEVVRDYTFIHDTFQVACEVNGTFDPSWSLRKMKEMHDKYVHEQVVKESSPDRFIGLDSSTVPEKIEEGGFKATLLSSFLDYAMERELQKHCIYTYAKQAFRLEYFAYRIEGPNGFRSTIGFDKSGYRVQHYKRHNQEVIEADAIAFAAKILGKFKLEQPILPHPGENYWGEIEF